MKTAVQLRQDSRFYCKVLHGEPEKTVQNEKGEVAIFPAGAIVAYFMAWERKRHMYLFRCAGGKGEQEIPGVYPAVDILVDAGTRTRVKRLRTVLEHLNRQKMDAATLPDGFWARLQALLEGKNMKIADVRELFSHGKI